MREGSPPPTCHSSGVMCHMSHVMCHNFIYFFWQSDETCQWRVCYQRGLTLLVLLIIDNLPEEEEQNYLDKYENTIHFFFVFLKTLQMKLNTLCII